MGQVGFQGIRRSLYACGLLSFVGVWSPVAAMTAADAALGQSPGGIPLLAVPAHLRLDDAVRLFREHGFDLLIADAAVAGARGQLRSAAAFPNPSVQTGGGTAYDYACRRGSSGCSPTQVNASVSDQGLLTDLVIGKRRLRIAVAESALQAAQLERADAERSLLFLVKQQFAQTVMAKARLEFSREAARMTDETVQVVAVRQRAGAVSEADLARAETQQLEAQQAVDSAAEALAASKASLAFLIGARSAAPDFEVDSDLAHALEPATLRQSSGEDILREALANRPDLKAAEKQVEGAQASLALAERQRVPDIALTAGWQQQGSGQDAIQPPTLLLGISLPLPVLYQQQGEIAKAEAGLVGDLQLRDKTQAQVSADVNAAMVAYDSARKRLDRMQSGLLERSRRARDLVRLQYEKGAASLLELLDAQRTYIATNTEYYETLTDYWTALFQVEQAMGKELTS